MRKITSLLMLFCMFVGMAWAGPTDLPQITTDLNNPIYYTIYNTRSQEPGGLMYYAGDEVGLKDGCEYTGGALDAKYKFYFTGSHEALYVHNAATGKKLASIGNGNKAKGSWTDEGTAWAVGVSPKGGGLAFGPEGGLGGYGCWNDCNYTTGDGNPDFTTWSANDAGSVFVCEKVEILKLPEFNKFYTIECPLFENVQRVKKALYLDESGELKWKTLDLTDKKFYWIPLKDGNKVILKSATTLIDGEEARTIKDDYTTNTIAGASDVKIYVLGNNNFKIVAGNTTFHAGGHNSGNGESGDILSWNGTVNSASAWTFVEQVDPDAAVEVIVRYNYTYNGEEKNEYTHETTTIVGAEYPALSTTLPFGVTGTKPAGTIAASDVVGGVVEKTIELSTNLPFTYADSGDDITNWYTIKMHSNNKKYIKYVANGNYLSWAEADLGLGKDQYAWAFIGNPFDGFKLVNKYLGAEKALKSTNSGNPSMQNLADATVFISAKSNQTGEGYFCLQYPSGNYLNAQNGKVAHWSDPDAGSTIEVATFEYTLDECLSDLQEIYNVVDNAFGTEPGQYKEMEADPSDELYTAWYVAGEAIKSEQEKDVQTLSLLVNNLLAQCYELQANPESREINLPEQGKFYRLKNVASGRYMNVKSASSVVVTDADAGYNLPTTIFYLGENNTMLSYSVGQYLDCGNKNLAAVGTSLNGEFALASSGAKANTIMYKNNGYWIFGNRDNDVSIDRGGSKPGANEVGYDWELEEVKWLPVPMNTTAGYATLYAPVALNNGGRVEAYVGKVEGDWFTMSRVDEEDAVIPANTPVVLKYVNGAQVENNCVYLQVSDSEKSAVVGEENELEGTFADTYVTTEAYALGLVEGEVGFYTAKMTDGQWLNNGFKAYLPKTTEAKTLRFNFDGETTAIDAVEVENAYAPIYDLSGRRVLSTVKGGIYIQNGKKFIVK